MADRRKEGEGVVMYKGSGKREESGWTDPNVRKSVSRTKFWSETMCCGFIVAFSVVFVVLSAVKQTEMAQTDGKRTNVNVKRGRGKTETAGTDIRNISVVKRLDMVKRKYTQRQSPTRGGLLSRWGPES